MGSGSLLGYFYGRLFFNARRVVPSVFTQIFFTILRFTILLAAGIYLLALPSIQPIILVLSFLATFWLVILTHKAPFHEGHRTFKR